ncbi:hypothetical protein UA08_05940 [Talaromyces atroroseus]|uniref:Uncharacterized protein n=1 Tax=Talaromyces atroroseus TaxID=1441469 RepID=A0A225AWP3_TALAT|nr:hypothetical protein UA08_05940 [Talaromyces atroroseus]OKL58865.1 hypothetical protein UA08_05940 [Talaromyces atroroseus]
MTFYTINTSVMDNLGKVIVVLRTLLSDLVVVDDAVLSAGPRALNLGATGRLSFAKYQENIKEDLKLDDQKFQRPWDYYIYVGQPRQRHGFLPNDRNFRAAVAQALSQTPGKPVIEIAIYGT